MTLTKITPLKFEITFDPVERRTLDHLDNLPPGRDSTPDNAEAQLSTVVQRWLESRLQSRRQDWARKNFVK